MPFRSSVIMKGVLKVKAKFNTWAQATIKGFTEHPVLLKFMETLKTKVSSTGEGITKTLKGFAFTLEKVVNTLNWVRKTGGALVSKVTQQIAKSKREKHLLNSVDNVRGEVKDTLEDTVLDPVFESVKEEIGGFLKDMMGRIGCFCENSDNRMSPWGVVMFEKVGTALSWFETFKEVGEFTSATKSCLATCADDTKQSE